MNAGMSDVSVFGLGSVGAAVAATFQRAGHNIAVWNRTRAKAEPFVAAGANLTSSVAGAVRASRLIVICVEDDAAMRGMMRADAGADQELLGRTLVQLSTGT